jgi:5-(carboxyamino)imidazole ribonucleotide synthase
MSIGRKPRVGVLGAGQLALMLAEAGQHIGVEVVCAGRAGDCAGRVAMLKEVDLESAEEVRAFSGEVDVLTLESENVEASVLVGLANLSPNAGAVKIAQDRLFEKDFLRFQGVPTAPYAEVSSLRDLHTALATIGAPAILKTRRFGYDGRGQVQIHHADEAGPAWAHMGGASCILEGMVHFDCEVSMIAVRSRSGESVFYPLIRNEHREGILRVSTAPYTDALLQHAAEKHLATLLTTLEYVGVLAVEFFVVGDVLVANEMAPLVHNSGHWTIEGAAASQFENHLRAVLGWPLGSTASEPMVMLNCVGSMPSVEETRTFAEIVRHDYEKASRAGRKVGHLTMPASATATIAKWKRRLS